MHIICTLSKVSTSRSEHYVQYILVSISWSEHHVHIIIGPYIMVIMGHIITGQHSPKVILQHPPLGHLGAAVRVGTHHRQLIQQSEK